jgi:two-component system response regulator QseB
LRSRAVRTRALLVSGLGTVADRVTGLDAGADDYLVKPFDLDELTARVRALARREADATDTLPVGSGRLDLLVRDVVLASGERIPLSGREFELLRVLAARPRAVHSRAELQRRVFADSTAPSIVDTYVYYLRRKLSRSVVRTVHGLGYRLGDL